MSELAKIKSRADRLSKRDRADLAYHLLHSLDDAEDPVAVARAWRQELDRRWRSIENGKEPGISAEQEMARLREKYS